MKSLRDISRLPFCIGKLFCIVCLLQYRVLVTVFLFALFCCSGCRMQVLLVDPHPLRFWIQYIERFEWLNAKLEANDANERMCTLCTCSLTNADERPDHFLIPFLALSMTVLVFTLSKFQSAFVTCVHSFLQNTNMAPEQFGPVDGEIHPGQALTIQADPFVQSVLPANPAFTDAIFCTPSLLTFKMTWSLDESWSKLQL